MLVEVEHSDTPIDFNFDDQIFLSVLVDFNENSKNQM